MRMQMHVLLLSLCLVGMSIVLLGRAQAEEKVAIRLMPQVGQTLRYKHKYSLEFNSDRAEVISVSESKRGMVQVLVNGEWKSQETVRPLELEPGEAEAAAGTVETLARLEDGMSQVSYKGKLLTYRQFPFTLYVLNGHNFSWRISPEGVPGRFAPEFKAYTLSRPDLITEVGQLWLPEVYPVCPEHAVGKGDTWSGHMAFELSFMNLDQKALVDQSCTYKVKKIKVKKGRTIVEIEEGRKIRYKGWIYGGSVSVFLDGEGEGSGKWEIDATRGVVLSHEIKLGVSRPEVTVVGQERPVANIRAQVEWMFQRKLEE